jgi:hypothetical protein
MYAWYIICSLLLGTTMTERVIAALLTAAAISLISSEAEAATSKGHKTVHRTSTNVVRTASVTHRHHSRSSGRHVAGLIPPPPAYMPCILPELYYHSSGSGITEVAVAEKKENPYSQYVKTPNGDAPLAMSSRKGVVTWHDHK